MIISSVSSTIQSTNISLGGTNSGSDENSRVQSNHRPPPPPRGKMAEAVKSALSSVGININGSAEDDGSSSNDAVRNLMKTVFDAVGGGKKPGGPPPGGGPPPARGGFGEKDLASSLSSLAESLLSEDGESSTTLDSLNSAFQEVLTASGSTEEISDSELKEKLSNFLGNLSSQMASAAGASSIEGNLIDLGV